MCENNADKIKILIDNTVDNAVEDTLNTILPDNTFLNKEKLI